MKKKKGFTFIETLIVIGIIALLAVAVFISVNPGKRFEDANDKQREVHLNSIYTAIERKITVEGGWFEDEKCDPLPQDYTEEGEEKIAIFKNIGTGEGTPNPDDYYDLYKCLVPEFMINELYDPDEGNEADSHYEIWQNPQTKYVTLRYRRVDPDEPDRLLKEIVAGAKKYGILSKPRAVDTKMVTSIGHSTAVSGGTVRDDGGAYVFEAGTIWASIDELNVTDCGSEGTLDELVLDNVDMNTMFRTIDGSGYATEGEDSFEFTSDLHSLRGGDVDYCVRAYARNEAGVGYGQVEAFATLDAKPYVESLGPENVTDDTASLLGRVETMADFPWVESAWFCWWGPDPDTSETCETVAGGVRAYPTALEISYTLSGLIAGETYHFKACAEATDIEGYRCGETLVIEPNISAPYVITLTDEEYEIGSDYAVVKGKIVSDGGLEVAKLGFCYSTIYGENSCSYDPYTSVKCVDASDYDTATGYFSATIPNPGDLDGLEPGYGYNVCAFASNGWEGNGLSYGGKVDFDTVKTAPVLTTKTATRSPTSPGSAVSGGIITSDGGELVTQRGVCWLSFPSVPATVDPAYCTDDGTGKGDFTSNIPVSATGLWADRRYNVRAYATNDIETSWAENVEELGTTTPNPPALSAPTTEPTDEDIHVDSIENVGGRIADHGGAAIGRMGICWSETNDMPTWNGTGCEYKDVTPNINLGEFYTDITGLSADTPYYVRAYAQNAAGFSYDQGVRILRTDVSDPPEVAVHPGTTVIDTGDDWVKIGGEVKKNGGDIGTIRGACYSGTGTPRPTYEIEDGTDVICRTDGTAGEVGLFEITITGLPIKDASGNKITYNALAFAHNNAGSAHGDDPVSFEIGRKDGESCTDFPDGSKCQSGFCVDGVCCNSVCSATCKACVASKTDAADGTCANITSNTDPDKECSGTCRVCKSGACSNASVNTDPENQCFTSNCGTGNCIGTSAACGYKNYSDGNCPACKTCDGATSINCVNKNNLTQDTTYPNYCRNANLCYNGGCREGFYYLYVTEEEYTGDLKGTASTARIGADNKCRSDDWMPSSCKGDAWAFISISTSDTIAKFPQTIGIFEDMSWYWKKGSNPKALAAFNWEELLDGDIVSDAQDAGFTNSSYYWTGSTASGYLYTEGGVYPTDSCLGWIYDTSYYHKASRGYYNYKTSGWLHYTSAGYCDNDYGLLCACLGI